MIGILRSIAGVVTGYLLFAVSAFAMFRLSGRDPHQEQNVPFVVGSVLWGMTAAFAGGYVAGVIAGRSPRAHGAAVALILALGATASILAQPDVGSRWSQFAALALMAPAAFAGGIARARGRK